MQQPAEPADAPGIFALGVHVGDGQIEAPWLALDTTFGSGPLQRACVRCISSQSRTLLHSGRVCNDTCCMSTPMKEICCRLGCASLSARTSFTRRRPHLRGVELRRATALQLIAEFAAHRRAMTPKGVICCACCPHAAVQAGTAQCNGASLTVYTLLCFAPLRCSLRTCRCPGTSAAGCSTLTPQSAGRASQPPPAAPASAACEVGRAPFLKCRHA